MPDTLILPDVWPTDETELAALIGAVAARELLAGTEAQRHNAWHTMRDMAASETNSGPWMGLAINAITDSARFARARGNWEALHSVCSFAYTDGNRRDRERGVPPECHLHSLYAMAHRQAMREQGHPVSVPECRCDPVRP